MEQTVITLITVYIALMSFLGWILMGVDKRRAKKKEWRIPERTLILIAYLGGGIGSFLGMYSFRHKTKHIKFVILLPIAALLDVILLLELYRII